MVGLDRGDKDHYPVEQRRRDQRNVVGTVMVRKRSAAAPPGGLGAEERPREAPWPEHCRAAEVCPARQSDANPRGRLGASSHLRGLPTYEGGNSALPNSAGPKTSSSRPL